MLGEISSQSDMNKLLNKIEAKLKKPYMKTIRENELNFDRLEPDHLLKRPIRLVEDAYQQDKLTYGETQAENLPARKALLELFKEGQ